MDSTTNHGSDGQWLGATVRHKGMPMLLRVRPRAGDVAERSCFPVLVAATHELDQVRADGLPEPEYNESLAEFDYSLMSSLAPPGQGITVIVETFAGKRTYYAYVRDAAEAEQRVAELRTRFPGHSLRFSRGKAPGWDLYDDYRSRWPW